MSDVKKVIITGPTGAIGMALIERCIKNNIQVLAVVNPDSKRKHQLQKFPELEVIEADISSYLSLEWKDEYDVWFHLAWCGASGEGRNDMYMQNQNVTYLLDAVTAAQSAGCHSFIGAGSQAEYGISSTVLAPNSPTNPNTGYGMAKLCAGQMGRKLAEQIGIRFVWARIFSVYGPYDGENTMIMKEIQELLAGRVPRFTKGEQQWDYLYSEDAADILLRLSECDSPGKIYCVGSGSTKHIAEYIEIIREYINQDAKVDIGAIPYGEQQIMYLCADTQLLKADTGFRYFTSFEDGIQRTIHWKKKEAGIE